MLGRIWVRVRVMQGMARVRDGMEGVTVVVNNSGGGDGEDMKVGRE